MTALQRVKPSFRFGRFVLDPDLGALMIEGTELPLRAKSFALLELLVSNSDRLVAHDEIMRCIWPGVTVGDAVIAQSIRDIRRAVGEDGERFIRSVPRRGYRFTEPVVRIQPKIDAEAAPAPSRLPLPKSGRPILLVQPFTSVATEPGREYFADGLTADLVTDLTRCQELHVITPLRRDNLALDPAPAPAPIQADYLLEGIVQRGNARIRVNARLSESESGRVVWSERFDRPLADIFIVQTELSALITASVDIEIEQDSLRRSLQKAPESLTAYDLFLQGRDLFGRGNAATAAVARDLFNRAIEADPRYAPSYAYQSYIALRGFTLNWGDLRGRAALDRALALADQGYNLAPRSPLANMRRAFVLSVLARDDEAIASGTQGVFINPNDAESRATQGEILSRGGFHAQGAAELKLAMSLNPYHTPVWHATIGRALLFDGEAEEALRELRRASTLAPDYSPSQSTLAVACVEAGLMDEARAALRQLWRLKPGSVLSDHRAVCGLRRKQDEDRFVDGLRAAGMPD